MLSGEWFLLVSAAWAGSNIANLTISGTNLNIKQRGGRREDLVLGRACL